jgi:hypothetical protein
VGDSVAKGFLAFLAFGPSWAPGQVGGLGWIAR